MMVRYLFWLGIALTHSHTTVLSQETTTTATIEETTANVEETVPKEAAAVVGGQVLDGVTLSADCVSGGQDGCITREAIQALSLMMGVDVTSANRTALNSFDVDRIMTCMAEMSTDDVDLIKLSDVAWSKMVEYHNTNAALNTTTPNKTQSDFDIEPAPMQLHDGSVYLMVSEPCNAVSNLAFYRSMLAFCEMEDEAWTFDEEIKKTMAQLQALHAFAGTFSHISNVGSVGELLDDVTTQLTLLLSYQGAVQNFKDEPIVYSFNRSPTYTSAVEATKKLAQIIMEEDVENWSTELEALHDVLPKYYSGIVGTLTVVLNLMLPPEISILLNTAVGQILEVSTYPIQLGPALRNVKIDYSTASALLQMATGTAMKGTYSLFWLYMETDDALTNDEGAKLMPLINAIGNLFTGFDRSHDPAVQEATNVYPGDQDCRTNVGHAKFQEQLANTIVDIGLLNSAINGAINGKKLSPDMDGLELAICYEENKCTNGFDVDAMTAILETNVNDCMPHLYLDPTSVPMVDFASYASCMFSSLVWAKGIQTLDSCLAENKCIQFNTQLMIKDEPLLNCVLENGYTAPTAPMEPSPVLTANSTVPVPPTNSTVRRALQETAPVETTPAAETTPVTTPVQAEPVTTVEATPGSCASYVNQEEFSLCQSQCDGTLCTLNCMQKHGDDSALFSTASACMNALVSPDSAEAAEFKALCMEQEVVLSEVPSFIQLFIQGTRELVVCSATFCDMNHKNFLSVIYGIPSCTTRCLEMAPEERLFPVTTILGESMSCTLECFLQQQTLNKEKTTTSTTNNTTTRRQ